MNLDLSGIDPSAVRDKPRLPSPAWSLLFVWLALLDLTQAMVWLVQQGPRQLTGGFVLRMEGDIAWGILLGGTLVAVYLRAAPRNFCLLYTSPSPRD